MYGFYIHIDIYIKECLKCLQCTKVPKVQESFHSIIIKKQRGERSFMRFIDTRKEKSYASFRFLSKQTEYHNFRHFSAL